MLTQQHILLSQDDPEIIIYSMDLKLETCTRTRIILYFIILGSRRACNVCPNVWLHNKSINVIEMDDLPNCIADYGVNV